MQTQHRDEKAVDHGGSLGRARALFPDAPQPFVDLSTGINPHAYPTLDIPATALTRLPEPARIDELSATAARAYRAPSGINVVAAPGTQILLPRVAALVPPGTAKVLGPTYEEHRVAAETAGHACVLVTSIDQLRDSRLAVIVNPNNPDGRVVRRADILALAEDLRGQGGLVVVDEAFMDVGPSAESVTGDVEALPIVVLRSFGKFFGLAGVRLGFAICAEPLARRLRAELGPWAVAGTALEYGLSALTDIRWQEDTRDRLDREAHRLDGLFEQFGVSARGGTSLFRHFKLAGAPHLYQALGSMGVILRAFADRPDELRCGLPANEREWSRLETALAKWGEDRGV